jgi:ferredoxin
MKVCFGNVSEFESREGESILQLAQRVTFPIASGCFSGGCGVCKVHLAQGHVRVISAMSRKHVSREEEADGYFLACCAIPETNIEIDRYTRFKKEYGFKIRLESVSVT